MGAGSVIIFKDKHYDRIYRASTPEERRAAMLTELVYRHENGYINPPERSDYRRTTLSEADQSFLDLTDEQVAALPEPIRKQALRVKEREKREEDYYQRELAEWAAYEKVFNTYENEGAVAARDLISRTWTNRQNGKKQVSYLVEELIERRSGYEYEGYETVSFEQTLEDEEKSAAKKG